MDKVFHDLPRLIGNVRGVVHVGAHLGQEVDVYREMGAEHILLFEPQANLCKKLWERLQHTDGVKIIDYALGDFDGHADLNVTDFDQRSSILKPIDFEVTGTARVAVRRLTTVFERFGITPENYDLLVIDAQGSELNILKGADLSHFEHIVVEINSRPRYYDAPTFEQVDSYLSDFTRITEYPHGSRGMFDAVYTRNTACHPSSTTSEKP